MQGKSNSRDDRLKAALRENLKRRKAQARARQDEARPTEREDDRPARRDRNEA